MSKTAAMEAEIIGILAKNGLRVEDYPDTYGKDYAPHIEAANAYDNGNAYLDYLIYPKTLADAAKNNTFLGEAFLTEFKNLVGNFEPKEVGMRVSTDIPSINGVVIDIRATGSDTMPVFTEKDCVDCAELTFGRLKDALAELEEKFPEQFAKIGVEKAREVLGERAVAALSEQGITVSESDRESDNEKWVKFSLQDGTVFYAHCQYPLNHNTDLKDMRRTYYSLYFDIKEVLDSGNYARRDGESRDYGYDDRWGNNRTEGYFHFGLQLMEIFDDLGWEISKEMGIKHITEKFGKDIADLIAEQGLFCFYNSDNNCYYVRNPDNDKVDVELIEEMNLMEELLKWFPDKFVVKDEFTSLGTTIINFGAAFSVALGTAVSVLRRNGIKREGLLKLSSSDHTATAGFSLPVLHGEDYRFEITYPSRPKDFPEAFKEFARGFDKDKYIVSYIVRNEHNGNIPISVNEVIEDAQYVCDTLARTAKNLDKEKAKEEQSER